MFITVLKMSIKAVITMREHDMFMRSWRKKRTKMVIHIMKIMILQNTPLVVMRSPETSTVLLPLIIMILILLIRAYLLVHVARFQHQITSWKMIVQTLKWKQELKPYGQQVLLLQVCQKMQNMVVLKDFRSS